MSTKAKSKVYTCCNFIQFWLLPGQCIVCKRASQRHFDLCRSCEVAFTDLEHPCRACALPLPPSGGQLCGRCLSRKCLIHHTVAAFAYAAPVSSLISQFKYQGKLQHGRVLTALLLAQVHEYYHDTGLPEALIPVPLHPNRLRERGFNQALLMAQQLGSALAIPVIPEPIRRIQQTPPQQGLTARERKRNLRRAFSLAPGADLQAYRSVALIDDVVTTMSTANELARLLHRYSKREIIVHVWCLARA